MSSKAKRRRDRLARRRRTAQEEAILFERARRKRWGDGIIYRPGEELPPMRDVTGAAPRREPLRLIEDKQGKV